MTPTNDTQLRVIDSHTAGEPTRVVVEGAPLPKDADMGQLRAFLHGQADWVRRSLTLEPRGAPWMVGALLAPPSQPGCDAGVVFFNNTGYLGMCGHGLIGVVSTLKHLRRVEAGDLRIETPVGEVAARLHADGSVSFENVLSHRSEAGVTIDVPGVGPVTGDIAYGGNWFFLTQVESLDRATLDQHLDLATRIKRSLTEQGVRGGQGAEIDHIELFAAPPDGSGSRTRNLVLCPGGEYDRSPCGTGTSAKVACLAADGKLSPGELWSQESILGGCFTASYRTAEGGVIPCVRGRAYVTAETTIRFNPEDPLDRGLPTAAPR